ncbi:hypothetical protein LCGC14_1612720, partial [marine sediment metagenome]
MRDVTSSLLRHRARLAADRSPVNSLANRTQRAISVDRVRQMFPKMIAADQRYGITTVLEVAMLA